MSKAEQRRRLFLEVRSILNETGKKLRTRKQVVKLIAAHRSRLNTFIKKSSEDKVTDKITTFVEQKLFESDATAKLHFPELFQPSAQRQSQHEASERKAEKSEAAALKQVVEEQDVLNGINSMLNNVSSASDEPIISEGPAQEQWLGIEPLSKIDAKTDAALQEDTLDSDATKATLSDRPSLFPSYLSIDSQNQLLNHVQKRLEECSFNFAQTHLPDVLAEKDWTCSSAAELNTWAYILGRKYSKIPQGSTTAESSATYRKTFDATAKIRHAAVHRLKTTSKGVLGMVEKGLSLSQMLKDEPCTLWLEVLQSNLRTTIKDLEMHKNNLENELDEHLSDIAERRKQLDIEEKEAKAVAQVEDKEIIDRLSKTFVESLRHLEAAGNLTLVGKEEDSDGGIDNAPGEADPPTR